MNADVEEANVESDKEHRNQVVFIVDGEEAIVESEKEHWKEEIVQTYREFLLSGSKKCPNLPT